MRTPRIYTPCALTLGAETPLDNSTSHYLIKVLRMEVGRPLIAFNGDGTEYSATLTKASKRNASILIESEQECDRESPLHTHLAIAISRGERMDWVFQKATELGVTEITPLFTLRTEIKLKGERLQKKMEHWQQVIISSCEQCQRNTLPKLNDAISLEKFLQTPQTGLKLALHHRSDQPLKSHPSQQAVTLLIGPEGGLDEVEINQALTQYQYQALSLGPRVLRTETAPIAALTAVQLQWGDLNL